MAHRFPNCICCISSSHKGTHTNDCCVGVLFPECLTLTITSDCAEFDGQTVELCFNESDGCWVGTLNLLAGQLNCGIWTFKFCCADCSNLTCNTAGTGPSSGSTPTP